ncbi:MAG: phage tail protein [Ruminococcus sp.]
MSSLKTDIGYFGIPASKKRKRSEYIAFRIISDSTKGTLGALTFNNMKEDVTARWGKHYIQGRKPKSEFLGMELTTINLTVELDASLLHPLKTTPFKARNRIIKLCQKGYTGYLVIGGHKMSGNKFKIISVSDSYEIISRGKLPYTKDKFQKIIVDIVFEEIV